MIRQTSVTAFESSTSCLPVSRAKPVGPLWGLIYQGKKVILKIFLKILIMTSCMKHDWRLFCCEKVEWNFFYCKYCVRLLYLSFLFFFQNINFEKFFRLVYRPISYFPAKKLPKKSRIIHRNIQ